MNPRPRKPPKSPLDHEPEALAYARRKAGLSQAELARRVGVAFSLVSEWERGTRNCTHANQIKVAETLNCPVVVLERKRVAGEAARQTTPEAPTEDVA
ncbi:helix-turn-helix domain-containing protein [Streptomyces blattellae]|uniref:helix-turn-helix domain-containing protein n=1 Tax=Streptomyces blattellae TaxID=2569855 RepID=UPI0012B7271C|nr:helix-turn-helix transcriptional regulator [Streptomyces blattellae]